MSSYFTLKCIVSARSLNKSVENLIDLFKDSQTLYFSSGEILEISEIMDIISMGIDISEEFNSFNMDIKGFNNNLNSGCIKVLIRNIEINDNLRLIEIETPESRTNQANSFFSYRSSIIRIIEAISPIVCFNIHLSSFEANINEKGYAQLSNCDSLFLCNSIEAASGHSHLYFYDIKRLSNGVWYSSPYRLGNERSYFFIDYFSGKTVINESEKEAADELRFRHLSSLDEIGKHLRIDLNILTSIAENKIT